MFIKNESSNIEQTVETITAKQSTETTISFPFYSSPSVSSFIYVTDKEEDVENVETPLKSDYSESYSAETYNELNASFPLFFESINTIYIPTKVKTNLEKNVPKKLLIGIDANIHIAVEKCLLIASSLSSTIYSDNRWKELSSTIMDEQTRKGNDNTRIYPKIIKVLNPLNVNFDKASTPPTTTLSNCPCLIIRQPNIIAFAADEQAVEMVVT